MSTSGSSSIPAKTSLCASRKYGKATSCAKDVDLHCAPIAMMRLPQARFIGLRGAMGEFACVVPKRASISFASNTSMKPSVCKTCQHCLDNNGGLYQLTTAKQHRAKSCFSAAVTSGRNAGGVETSFIFWSGDAFSSIVSALSLCEKGDGPICSETTRRTTWRNEMDAALPM